MPHDVQIRGVAGQGGSQKGAPGKTPGGSRVWISEGFSSKLARLFGDEKEKEGVPAGLKCPAGGEGLDDQPGIARRLSLRACVTGRQVLPGRDPPAKWRSPTAGGIDYRHER